MDTLASTIDHYLDAWNETETNARDKLIQQVWAIDGRLVDPPLAAHGHSEIGDMARRARTEQADWSGLGPGRRRGQPAHR
jgi:hypothetical protein